MPNKLTLTKKQAAVLDELHPALRSRIDHVIEELDGRLVPLCGHRPMAQQLAEYRKGRIVEVAADGLTVVSARVVGSTVTNAAPGQSPHNFKPSLAVDLVLNTEIVRVGKHPQDARYLNAWETRPEWPEAVAAWKDLGAACLETGLVHGGSWRRRDLPHVEMPQWRTYLDGGSGPYG